MSKKRTYKTKVEQKHLNRVTALGCIVCKNLGYARWHSPPNTQRPCLQENAEGDVLVRCCARAFYCGIESGTKRGASRRTGIKPRPRNPLSLDSRHHNKPWYTLCPANNASPAT